MQKRISNTDYGEYGEHHHITPRSLGGTDEDENIVKLTAREHFICHWLLVKIYKKGSIERKKMLCAFWKMKQSPTKSQKRYLNSRAYEKLKIEFSNTMKYFQSNEKNSQFGKKWFTNYETGESHSFLEKPNDKWLEGRNLFNGKTSKLKFKVKLSQKTKTNVSQKFISLTLTDKIKQTEFETKNMWNSYHSGNYHKLEEYANILGISKIALYNRFAKYIPIYTKHKERKRKHFSSDLSLVNVFE